jgi:hypothetical protein
MNQSNAYAVYTITQSPITPTCFGTTVPFSGCSCTKVQNWIKCDNYSRNMCYVQQFAVKFNLPSGNTL